MTLLDVVVIGSGAVATSAVRRLAGEELSVGVAASSGARAHRVAHAIGSDVVAVAGSDPVVAVAGRAKVAVLAGRHDRPDLAKRLLEAGTDVVSVASAPTHVRQLLAAPIPPDRRLVVGAAMVPGLSDLLAAWMSAGLDSVEVLRIAVTGAGGPDCVTEARAEVAGEGARGGAPAGLVWFPEPFGGLRVRHAANGARHTLGAHFGDATVSVVRSPMGRRTGDDAPGAMRVEVEGRLDGEVVVDVAGAVERPSLAAGSVAAAAAVAIVGGLDGVDINPGVSCLGQVAAPGRVLARLARWGVRCARFVGS